MVDFGEKEKVRLRDFVLTGHPNQRLHETYKTCDLQNLVKIIKISVPFWQITPAKFKR